MIPIRIFEKYSDIEIEECVKKFYELNCGKPRDQHKIDLLDKWCKKHLPPIENRACTFKDVVTARPEQLRVFKEHIEGKKYQNIKLNKHMGKKGDNSKYKDDENSPCHYVVSSLYGRIRPEAKSLLVSTLGIKTCPYCNSNYIYSDKTISTFQLDHFFPKTEYEILAASFFNLIPVCPTCNFLKGTKVLDFYPYDTQMKDVPIFSYDIKEAPYLNNPNNIRVVLTGLEEEDIKTLKLDQRYNHHADVVLEALQKYEMFPDIYISELFNQFGELFATEREVRELLFGIPLQEKEFGNRPLSKLTYDILKERDQANKEYD